MADLSFREFLLRELSLRRRRNPNYSLRAFARDLKMPAPKLSLALRGLKGISAQRAQDIAKTLKLSGTDEQLFLRLVQRDHARSKLSRKQAAVAIAQTSDFDSFKELELERFKVISDWYHFAILELTDVADFESRPAWIARRLSITQSQAKEAIQRLLNFGLLSATPVGLKQTEADLATPSGIPSREIREQQTQLLEKAHDALTNVAINERDFSALTLACDSKDLPKAAELIKDFRRKFNRELQRADLKDRVYTLAIQFFPLDQMPPNKKGTV